MKKIERDTTSMPELYSPIRINNLDNYRLNNFISALEDVLSLGRWGDGSHYVHVIVRGCCTSGGGDFYDFSTVGRAVEGGGGHELLIYSHPGDIHSMIRATPRNSEGEEVWEQAIFSVVATK